MGTHAARVRTLRHYAGGRSKYMRPAPAQPFFFFPTRNVINDFPALHAATGCNPLAADVFVVPGERTSGSLTYRLPARVNALGGELCLRACVSPLKHSSAKRFWKPACLSAYLSTNTSFAHITQVRSW